MLALLRAPQLSTEEETRRARMFWRVALLDIVVTNLCFLTIAVTHPEMHDRVLGFFLATNVPGFALLEVNRRGYPRTASTLLVASFVLSVTLGAFSAGGVRSPGVGLYFVFVLIAAQLLGHRAGVVTAMVCAALAVGLVLLESMGMLSPIPVNYDAPTLLLINAMYMGLALAVMRLGARDVERALRRAEVELAQRRVAERERERLVGDLEKRVKELKLLHAASQLLQPTRAFEPALLEQLVALVPPAWMHSECCVARITYRQLEARSPAWCETGWQQRECFTTSAGEGTFVVGYLEQRPQQAEGPFLAEERALLGSLVEMVVAYLDYHEAERQRLNLERQLRHAQKIEALGKLAGGIAHDFNNLLTVMGCSLDFAMSDLSADSPVQESLGQILEAHDRAKELVNQILLFARKQEPERNLLALEKVVQDALKLLRASVASDIRVRSSCEPDLPRVLADAGQIHQVVMNLVTNASDAMRERGGELSVELSCARVTEQIESPSAELAPGNYVCLSVRDTGTGMSSDVLERLFEPFFTTKGQQGTGLGLSVVHGILREHRGAVVVRSELGRGSTFRVYLPAAELLPDHSTQVDRAPQSRPRDGETHRLSGRSF